MAKELSDSFISGDWDRRYPYESDMQDILDTAINDSRQLTSLDEQLSCVDWLGLSVADANRLRRAFNGHKRCFQRHLGISVSWHSSYNAAKTPSIAPKTVKDSFEETTRQLEEAWQEAEDVAQEFQTSKSSETKNKGSGYLTVCGRL